MTYFCFGNIWKTACTADTNKQNQDYWSDKIIHSWHVRP